MTQRTTSTKDSQAAGDTEPDREGGSNIIEKKQHTKLSVCY